MPTNNKENESISKTSQQLSFLLLGHLGSCSQLGTIPHLTQEDIGLKEDKKLLESINSRLQVIMKSEKYMLGHKEDSENDQTKAKLVILANNCLALRKAETEHHALLAKSRSILVWP